jgi:hypothetical protein
MLTFIAVLLIILILVSIDVRVIAAVVLIILELICVALALALAVAALFGLAVVFSLLMEFFNNVLLLSVEDSLISAVSTIVLVPTILFRNKIF